jgi:hypothetical protein
VNNPKKWLDVLPRNRPKFCRYRDVLFELVRFKQANRARLKNGSGSLSFASVFFGCSKKLDSLELRNYVSVSQHLIAYRAKLQHFRFNIRLDELDELKTIHQSD